MELGIRGYKGVKEENGMRDMFVGQLLWEIH